MKDFGVFLANLRSNAGLSLEDLAKLVASSRSTLSRLENNDVPQPFRGSIRKLVIALAEILCTSKKETDRYLELAGIDKTLLTETEEIQLGFTPRITSGSPEEAANLVRWERIYEQLIQQLEGKEVEVGISNSPPNLKLKIQEYANVLQEIRSRLDILNNKQSLTEPATIPAAQVHYASSVEGRLVVGHQYGEEFTSISPSSSLYALASDNARWLMQLANIERFAVDDCIILANSENFKGWEPHEVRTTVLTNPLPIPDDLAEIQRGKIATIEKHYFNAPHYRLVSATPAFSELDHLKIAL